MHYELWLTHFRMHKIKHSWKHLHSYTVPLFGLESVHAKVFNEIEHLDTFLACVKLYYASKNVNSIQFCWYFFCMHWYKNLAKGVEQIWLLQSRVYAHNEMDGFLVCEPERVCLQKMEWDGCVYPQWSVMDELIQAWLNVQSNGWKEPSLSKHTQTPSVMTDRSSVSPRADHVSSLHILAQKSLQSIIFMYLCKGNKIPLFTIL